MKNISETLSDSTLTLPQKLNLLSRQAECAAAGVTVSAEMSGLMARRICCDLNEGPSPFRPRYVLPDYARFLKQGSRFLRLDPPGTLSEAINHLLILYRYIPAIMNYPAYLGDLDQLLEPFITDPDRDRVLISQFLIHLDRTFPDAFVHANLGPVETRAGKLILEAEKALAQAVPNLSLKYSPSLTSDAFALQAIDCTLSISKPYFINHELYCSEYGPDYGISSCYNGLPIGGGSYTLVRLNLAQLAAEVPDLDAFMAALTEVAGHQMACMDDRIRHLVEVNRFFDQNFLCDEGLIDRNRFTAMFGVFGMAECINTLLKPVGKSERFGYSQAAADLARLILEHVSLLLSQHQNPYCHGLGGFRLHAQSGIDSDVGTTPGTRIPVGEEPDLLNHILYQAQFHPYFTAGTSDIFAFDPTAKANPQAVLDVLKGAMAHRIRTLALVNQASDLVRVTGYLVKKSDVADYRAQQPVLHDTVALGAATEAVVGWSRRRIYS